MIVLIYEKNLVIDGYIKFIGIENVKVERVSLFI